MADTEYITKSEAFMDNRFLFLGGDRRSIYAARAIMQRRTVCALGFDECPLPEGKFGAIVLPLPFMKDGVINAPLYKGKLELPLIAEYADKGCTVFSGGTSAELTEICQSNGLRLVDYFAEEPLTLKNAALTAEAAAAILIQHTEFSLCGAKVLITGGGRIALHTARLLRSFGSNVTVCARNAEQRAKASLEYCCAVPLDALPALCARTDIVINTVPAPLFSEEFFRSMHAGTVFLELASKPPKPEEALSAKYGVQYIYASGLPGKFSPKTAGEAIAETILARS